jgi:Mrp family chromosome partitioning ATPase
MSELLARLKADFDFVFIDSPPLVPVSDALFLAPQAEGVVLVVNAQKTPRKLVLESQIKLHRAHCTVLGAVLNQVHPDHSSYEYCYYGHTYPD